MRLTLFMFMKWNFYFTLKTEICNDQQIHSCLVTKNMGSYSLFKIQASDMLFWFPVIL